MKRRRIDVAPLAERRGFSRYVASGKLAEGPCVRYSAPITVDLVVSATLPVSRLMEVLSDEPFRFVLEGSRIGGIVTTADLQRVPVRIMAFGLVTLLEMHLRELVAKAFPDEEWHESLSCARLEKARQLQQHRLREDAGIGLLECAQLCDLRDIVVKRELSLGWTPPVTPAELGEQLRKIEAFRNTLAHAVSFQNLGTPRA